MISSLPDNPISDSWVNRVLSETFISLRNRNFKLFFIGQMISNTGNWLTNVALTLLVLKITRSGLAVGLLAACQYGPVLVLSIWAGSIADRSDKRRMLLLTQSLEMAQSVGLSVLAFMPHPPVGGLYALATCGGVLLSFDNPLRRSFVSEMVTAEDIPNAVVLYSTIVNTSRIFGPALVGLLVVTLGYGWCFAIDAATYSAVLFCLHIMRPEELHRQLLSSGSSRGAVREGLRYVISTPVLWISLGMLAAIGTLAYNFNVTLPLFVTNVLHGTEGIYTILYSIFSVGALVSSLVVAHRSLVRMRHVVWGAVALGAAMLVLASVSRVAVAMPVAFLVGIASILYTTATTTIVQVETKHEMHGRVLALQSVLQMGTAPIGGPLSGWLADAMGARAPILFGGIVCLVSAAFGYYAVRRCVTSGQQTECE